MYDGDWTVLDGGALEFELKGYERDEVVPLVVRLDFEGDATVRLRAWSVAGAERELKLDTRHAQLEPKDD